MWHLSTTRRRAGTEKVQMRQLPLHLPKNISISAVVVQQVKYYPIMRTPKRKFELLKLGELHVVPDTNWCTNGSKVTTGGKVSIHMLTNSLHGSGLTASSVPKISAKNWEYSALLPRNQRQAGRNTCGDLVIDTSRRCSSISGLFHFLQLWCDDDMTNRPRKEPKPGGFLIYQFSSPSNSDIMNFFGCLRFNLYLCVRDSVANCCSVVQMPTAFMLPIQYKAKWVISVHRSTVVVLASRLEHYRHAQQLSRTNGKSKTCRFFKGVAPALYEFQYSARWWLPSSDPWQNIHKVFRPI